MTLPYHQAVLDPTCPEVETYLRENDISDDDWERRHLAGCNRCQEFVNEQTEVVVFWPLYAHP